MTGYLFALSPCYNCGRPFTYNPHRVPSIPIKGLRQPICRRCVDLANPIRLANGVPAIVPLPDAYEPIPEGEL
jgi:hypothetical protein